MRIRWHEDPALFREGVNYTGAETGFASRLIEKDYFCTVLLQELSGPCHELVRGSESVCAYSAETFGPEGTQGRSSERDLVVRDLRAALACTNPDIPEAVAFKTEGRTYLVRVVVDVGGPKTTVITAYRTSRIEKDWRQP